jgi:carbonic anhydrase
LEGVKDRGLEVHGVMFDIATGKLRDLGVGTKAGGGGTGEEVVRGRHAQLVFRGGVGSMAVK